MGRRGRGITGLSLIASAGLLGAYIGYPGMRKAHAATACTVANNSDSGAGSLRACLADVNSAGGGTITFAESSNGTIVLASDLPAVTLTSSVTIIGNGASNTVIDGVTKYSGFYFDGAVAVVLSGLTIQNASSDYGAAIRTRSGATLSVSDSTFAFNNITNGDGGAIRSSGDATIANSTFTSNSTTGDADGGAIDTSSGNITVTDSTFTSNTAGDHAGAIRTSSGDITVTDSTFTGNTAVGDGGVLDTDDGNVTISDSTFTNSRSDDDGGVVDTGGGNVTVTRSTFTGNSAGDDGGVIGTRTGAISVTNSTFTTNTADDQGGAIAVEGSDGSASVNFVTMVGNTSLGNSTTEKYLGAVDSDGDATVRNSIVYDNTGGDVRAGVLLSASFSLFTSTSSVYPSESDSSLIFGEDPLLGALADNGGPTQTMMPGAGSPVLGAANPAGAPSTDQRGFTRTTNGRADMGAVERLGVPPAADPSQVPPSWHQAQGREQREAVCPPGMAPSWAEWPNERTGGWTCEYTTWWDVNEGVGGGWVTTPGFRAGSMRGR